MKAITMWQPWASLLACGAKKYETRSWATQYRGPIAIHAAKKDPHSIMVSLPHDISKSIYDCIYTQFGIQSGALNKMPVGCIIATAELVNCWRIVYNPGTDIDKAKTIPIGAELDVPKHHPDFHRYIVPTAEEMMFGDWTPGRYAWEFANMTMLPEPKPAKGMQRLWNWEVSEDVPMP
ncbi:ASCH domain-containing protein [Desulfosporosinus sp. PR]|uniref:ASCH domain-containing protein n=1 Tax=Candidatus Desulfosporosinus nitrosoreducens TaxID=3401928 RepID=UPI0027F516C7|nr:ASCH domain-containing protein [Desulfosporosinus sp. PR]MDQ7094195.1 ASCH domain-containing protein [Desulfosporosinus sp. PR]